MKDAAGIFLHLKPSLISKGSQRMSGVKQGGDGSVEEWEESWQVCPR